MRRSISVSSVLGNVIREKPDIGVHTRYFYINCLRGSFMYCSSNIECTKKNSVLSFDELLSALCEHIKKNDTVSIEPAEELVITKHKVT